MNSLFDIVEDGDEIKYIPQQVEVAKNLWLGSLPEKIHPHFKTVLSLAGSSGQASSGQHVIITHFVDGPLPDVHYIIALADMCNSMREDGPVLVHCMAGLNRSALIAALMLIRKEGMSAKAVIELLRAKRSSAVLHNRAFHDWLLMLDTEASQHRAEVNSSVPL